MDYTATQTIVSRKEDFSLKYIHGLYCYTNNCFKKGLTLLAFTFNSLLLQNCVPNIFNQFPEVIIAQTEFI